jgi:tetratricopeptide (TPR) repeat protein
MPIHKRGQSDPNEPPEWTYGDEEVWRSESITDDEKVEIRKKNDRSTELRRWAMEQWRTLPMDDAIEIVDQRRRSGDSEDRHHLTYDLTHFLSLAGRQQEAERMIDEMISALPDDVRFPIRKASLYLYEMEDPEKALDAIDMALGRAHRTGFFRREASGVKARILLKLGRGEQLTRTLEEIMSLEMKSRIPDIGRERDFVDRAPCGMIAADVLARYNAFCPKRDND